MTESSPVPPWGEMAYDNKTPAEVVHDYAVVRGDLTEQYARDQLARWIERYAAHVRSRPAQRVESLLTLWEANHSHLGVERSNYGPSSASLRAALGGEK